MRYWTKKSLKIQLKNKNIENNNEYSENEKFK